ncbi:hypothetical protein LCGC14_0568060 [marine sediment metagenome]|uniref:Portal protein n=1 Tax=marine sediment metagenome TaxID=412755 RepID=A0A0F9U6H1_9ZZZZ
MSLFTKLRDRLPSGLKALLQGQVRFPGRSMIMFDFDRASDSEMARDVGDGTGADVLMTPVRWIQKSMREAPVQILDGAGEPLEGNGLGALLARPNPEYPWETLLDGVALSLSLDGNAYWVVARNDVGDPVELWYAPHSNMEPRWPADRNDVFISHYEYKVAGRVQRLEPEDVVHFRDGVDLDNIRLGISPLKGLLREIWTDNEAAVFTASLLRNGGVPGLVISPADSDVDIDQDQADAIKANIETQYTRNNRGRVMVMTGPTKVEQFGFSPKELDLSPLRDISEERVTAALGVQSAVVGFGSGLQQTKVGATMRELRQLSWFNGVIPMQATIAGGITRSLAPAFGAGAVAFNNTGVEALRENEDTKAKRLGELYAAGVITRAEARAPVGFESTDTDNVYRVSFTDLLLPQGVEATGLLPAAPGTTDPNTNGKVAPELLAVLDHALEAGLIPEYHVTPLGIVTTKQQQEDELVENTPRRIVIVGGPRRGKSTVARAFRDEHQIPTLCTDPLRLVKDPESGVTYLPEGLGWSEASKFVADHWLLQPGPWVIEGIATVRALRKFLRERGEGAAELLEGVEVIVLTDGHPEADINPRQEATAKAVATIWDEISSSFPDAEVRGQAVEPIEGDELALEEAQATGAAAQ